MVNFSRNKYHQFFNKSIKKSLLENYLFEDYQWKSGIPVWNLILKTSGRSPQDEGPGLEISHTII